MHSAVVFYYYYNYYLESFTDLKFACPGCLDLNKPFGSKKYAVCHIEQYSLIYFSFMPYALCSSPNTFKRFNYY